MSEDIASRIKELFDQGIEAGLNAAGVQRSFILELELSPVQAISEYNKLAREAGLTMSNEERKAKLAEILNGADFDSEESILDVQQQLVDTFDIAPSTAMNHIRSYAKEKQIVLAGVGAPRAPIATREAVVSFLIDNQGAERKVLTEGLVGLGYKKSTADSLIFMIPFMEEYARQLSEQ